MASLVSVLAVLLTAGAIALSADLFRMAGLSLYTEQYLAALLAIATPLVFLHFAADGTKGQRRVPWYDLAADFIAFIAAAYLAVRFHRLSELVSRQPWDGLVAAFMWPFYSDMDRLEAARRRSSNQSLEPTAGRRDDQI